MFERSVIKTTGQWWKALAGFAGLMAGTALLFAGFSFGIVLVPIGFAIGLGSAIFAVAAIRCPRCGNRWVWSAMRTQASDSWLAWLLARSECPECGHPSSAPAPTL